ncbi:HTH domain-containing protein [Phenylobacterium aquaticum]|uniref:HTH domain-containing protein n=1 Tax=Phenylobacterium aquaticum TaxID=1763816 RepID=UPI001F5D2FC1|nr:HTH domain-containing protein [Phenylobacterium aquaticum]MCI3135031.1 helix-turn-helix domain-containing protein [Phenylobacterium aquaticum]
MPAPAAVRASVHLTLAFIRITRGCTGGDLVRALIFAGLIDANVGHLDDNPETSRRAAALDPDYPDSLRRPIRAQRIAESLGLPRQTTRYKINQLIQMGLAQEGPDGLIIPSAALISDSFLLGLVDYLAALAAYVAELAPLQAVGLAADERLVDPIWPVSGAAMRMATRHVLRVVGELRDLLGFEGLMEDYVLLGLLHETIAAGGGQITGVSLAEKLGVPRETVRRHLAALRAQGRLEAGAGGFSITASQLSSPPIQALMGRIEGDGARMVRRLRGVGAIVTPTA